MDNRALGSMLKYFIIPLMVVSAIAFMLVMQELYPYGDTRFTMPAQIAIITVGCIGETLLISGVVV